MGAPSPPYREGGGAPVLPQAATEDQLDDLVAGLTASQQKQLLDKLALAQYRPAKLTKDETRDLDMWTQAIYAALVDALGGSVASAGGPLILKRLLAVPSSWTPVQAFMRDSQLEQLDVKGRMVSYQTLATLLVEHCKGVAYYLQTPLTPKFVANNCGQLGGVFENAFPGYVANGLARVIATRRLAA